MRILSQYLNSEHLKISSVGKLHLRVLHTFFIPCTTPLFTARDTRLLINPLHASYSAPFSRRRFESSGRFYSSSYSDNNWHVRRTFQGLLPLLWLGVRL